jgi:hypothetical protein
LSVIFVPLLISSFHFSAFSVSFSCLLLLI